ncbi:hypothetical protein [Rosistilla oblonga]|uniref:hypothetical protein n=1 Tax=Rosistilla oblonga TaxID=2527990 RepID=UPI003A975F98
MANCTKSIVPREREVNMFAELSHGHFVLCENLREQRSGHQYESMSCLIVAAFKFEAFLNDIGSRLLPYWDEIDRISHRNKLAVIAKQIDFPVDYSKRPFQTLIALFDARNELAHARPQSLVQTAKEESGTPEELRRRKPLTKWESLCTLSFAEQAYTDTEQIADKLWVAAGYNINELRSRGMSYSMSSIPSSRGKQA